MHTPDKISHTISTSLFEGGIVWQQTSVFSPCAYLMKSLTRSGALATREHRSITNYIEFVLLKHLEEVEKAEGTINVDNSPKGV